MSLDTTKLIDLPDDLTFWYDETHWFPFIEDEDCNITGPGHQDKEVFAAAVRSYDRLCGVEDGGADTASDVTHQWVIPRGERLIPCTEASPESIPVTTIWGAR